MKKLLFLLCASVYACSVCYADSLHLKNGRTIEGVIEREDSTGVVLNVGAGTITFSREEIASIQRDTPDERSKLEQGWSVKYFAQPEYTPERLQFIATAFRKLADTRKRAADSKIERDGTLAEIKRKEAVMKDLNSQAIPVTEKLKTLKPDENVNEYNALVTQYNYLMAQMRQKTDETVALNTRIQTLDSLINTYADALNQFKFALNKKMEELSGALVEEEQFFLDTLQQELAKMQEDFATTLVEYRLDANNVLVKVLLNGTVKAEFVVDTGASLVIISPAIARRLGVVMEEGVGNLLSMTLGDGRKVNAFPVVLNSLEVGEAKVQNVRAAVLSDAAAMEVEGLLGMSFLENFSFKIDGANRRLILEEFRDK